MHFVKNAPALISAESLSVLASALPFAPAPMLPRPAPAPKPASALPHSASASPTKNAPPKTFLTSFLSSSFANAVTGRAASIITATMMAKIFLVFTNFTPFFRDSTIYKEYYPPAFDRSKDENTSYTCLIKVQMYTILRHILYHVQNIFSTRW
ncbi:MAG: hypothetical protein IJ973_05330 [Christensenellaceae bacterium]|nr:hypothetical protein [Christensenellaceae bacterium]